MYDQSRAKNAVLLISDVWLSKSGGRKSGRDGCVMASVAVMFADGVCTSPRTHRLTGTASYINYA